MTAAPNKPDAPNPTIALQFHAGPYDPFSRRLFDRQAAKPFETATVTESYKLRVKT